MLSDARLDGKSFCFLLRNVINVGESFHFLYSIKFRSARTVEEFNKNGVHIFCRYL